MTYAEVYKESLDNPESFWAKAAQKVHWYNEWDKVLDSTDEHYRWFVGGCMNTCYNALDLHVHNGRGDQLALIYDSPVTDTKKKYTYKKLRDRVAKVAGILSNKGVIKGDRVIIYMPMIPEAVIAMLACARIGAIHSVVFGGFASHELAARIEDAKPRVVMTASCGIEVSNIIEYKPILDEAIKKSTHKPTTCIVWQRPQFKASMLPWRDVDWEEEEEKTRPVDPVPVLATDPLYILYTSGTTGSPKGVIRSNGGHSVAMKWSMDNIYNAKPGDVFFTASDVGWVVGHSYIVYAPLMNGCTTIVYEGKPVRTPNPSAFWRIIDEYKVNVLFSAPTAFRAIRKEDPKASWLKQFTLESLRAIFVAGERCDSDTLKWIMKITKKPVIDNWWQTETGWAIAANPLGLEEQVVKPGSPTKPMPGFNLKVLDEETGKELGAGKKGALCLKLPLPPASLMGIWENDERYRRGYLDKFPGYYVTGDMGYIDKDGYVFVLGRIDGIINVAGHRLSTGEMEEIIAKHPDVAECAVIGVNDALKGEIPMGFIVLKDGIERDHRGIVDGTVALVRQEIGAVASFKVATVVSALPKTKSGKILRKTLKEIADGVNVNIPATIEDKSVLDICKEAINALGYPKTGEE
ncbi:MULTISPECIES: propionyl-CoA synthetase [unclassified Campylobacter]|uniref:propionyl-CoA synthetase n=1 Tax=unclassified Campylobacter TaxID=2593542 RepID=UPI00123807B6|nr:MULTISPECIES: propionyl-CoA synthetase [unclassified Campylobacter]KAA6225030.1 propionyl-CoA synthetase [Campylobacter sp. LR185c]KAA6225989.1 propionyl-CoA synthetase [Campylobacter sp. LR196d]KAA6226066.1 propionyl-CoA synthetase [Campylobacter sp. LR286c]KAA6230359.1 propionyl-CoA synthetase [Campylobacter sp. LR264d]KAA6230984.1 propionyl-CoA synthetase [Campylobacter sp. LR291e]